VSDPTVSSTEPPELVDLLHLGRPQVIGTWLLGDVVIDPGPASCLAQLLPQLEVNPPRVIALTHIHLDHAGSTGTLARRFPDAEVWVHERGARHLADPSRLLASAGRLYGEHMQMLWGEVLPVPAERLRVLHGGESLAPFEVAYTPGHASHHVSYLHEPSGWAFTGDVAGVRIAGGPTVAPTPPPDIDLLAWRSSIALIEEWKPSALAATHFGAHTDVAEQLGQLRAYLDEVEALARTLDEVAFIDAMRDRVSTSTTAGLAGTYGQAMPAAQSYAGLARYLQREQGSN
jgi:glyoxylase-like metal-dependent hydrolase (beta-lactamase superfamily II)